MSIRNKMNKTKIELTCKDGEQIKTITFQVPTEDKARETLVHLHPSWEIVSLRAVQ